MNRKKEDFVDESGYIFDPQGNLIFELRPNLDNNVSLPMKLAWVLVNNRGSGIVATNLISYIFIKKLESCSTMDDIEKLKSELHSLREPWDF